MGRQLVLAYTIAGAAVAAAIIAASAATFGLTGAAEDAPRYAAAPAAAVAGPGAQLTQAAGAAQPSEVEYVYVEDSPAYRSDDDAYEYDDHDDEYDDEYDDDEHERRRGFLGWLVGDDHDDDE